MSAFCLLNVRHRDNDQTALGHEATVAEVSKRGTDMAKGAVGGFLAALRAASEFGLP
jgi:hypothetical protein